MKRLLSTLSLALFLVFPGSVLADFSDVSSLNPHKVAIDSLVAQGVLKGYGDGSFKPDQAVTRAEALKIILVGLDIDLDSAAANTFSDVKASDWYYPYVSTAVSLGIVKGYEDKTFRPSQNVNRAEAVKMAMVAADIEVPTVSSGPFIDVSSDKWYINYAAYAKEWNLVPPQSDARWHGEEPLTRAKISELIYRMQHVTREDEVFPESMNWLWKAFPNVELAMKVPYGWNMKNEGIGAVWLLDSEHVQFSPLTPYDNGGTLLMTRYSNPGNLGQSALFNSLHASIEAFTHEEKVNGLPAVVVDTNSGSIYKEWYILLPNGRLVHLQALRGDGAYSPYVESYLEAMVNTIQFKPAYDSDLSLPEIIESLRSGIKVDGNGQKLMDQLEDWSLIETDSIGVGTGPVDYFFSESANLTVKYERSFDVILDIREGSTSAF